MAATTKAKKSLLSQAKELSHSNRPILARYHGKKHGPNPTLACQQRPGGELRLAPLTQLEWGLPRPPLWPLSSVGGGSGEGPGELHPPFLPADTPTPRGISGAPILQWEAVRRYPSPCLGVKRGQGVSLDLHPQLAAVRRQCTYRHFTHRYGGIRKGLLLKQDLDEIQSSVT